jgi:hypothetical protein
MADDVLRVGVSPDRSPCPGVIAAVVVEDVKAALQQLAEIEGESGAE